MLDQPKLEELRIAVLNELKDFVPENHFTRVARYDPKSRATLDKDLYRHLYEDKDNHPLKYLPRHIAALNLFYNVQSYNSLCIALSIANEMQSIDDLLNTWQGADSEKFFDPGHINKRLLEVENEIEKSLKNWLSYLTEEESRPFENGFLRSTDDYKKPTRREQQISAIKNIAIQLGYDLHQIPDGGKSKIKDKCLSNYKALFTESTFPKAWQYGLNKGYFRMANHEKHSNKR